MSEHRFSRIMSLVVICTLLSLLMVTFAAAEEYTPPVTDGPDEDPVASHRLIVELESPPLTRYYKIASRIMNAQGKLDVNAPEAQQYVAQLEAEQAAFINEMQTAVPGATVSTFTNEYGMEEEATYQIVMNAVTVETGDTDRDVARRRLAKLSGVKHVYLDFAHSPDLYASNPLLGSPAVWSSAEIGGRENAGAGVKVASMDGGVHKDAPMFAGTGYSYPSGWPADGLGLTDNNNGKIIASRVYFRPWDPPAEGEENPWPGETGTSHGVHTAGIAAGDVVTASYLGVELPNMSGVAPKAWVMSYRVFYNSVAGIGAFYTAEGIAALEDIVADGADVLNNSWGGGPTSAGGEFDALDTALINAAESGIFISMSAGNAGPGKGTTDHPSDDYINVAATTTTGTLASGVMNVIAPEPISPTLQGVSYGVAEFGQPLTIGTTITHTFATAASVVPTNATGCEPFPANAFDGVAAVISRGGCYFSDKVRHAQQAGAIFAVIYNNDGDTIINMACGDDCTDIDISSIFIGQTYGEAMVDWYNEHGTDSVLEIDTLAFQAGNEPDYVASFSSRGPGVGHVLKPDIAAPGVNILSQGYTSAATGEARHLGYGQASGTSMAAPHVAGAAALLRQIYPDWSNAEIKSAMMSTAKYLEVYNHDGSPAQPLDIGAGRLNIAAAMDPGVILDPPSLSFGAMTTGTTKSIMVEVTNVTTDTEEYDLSTLYTGDGFAPTQTTVLTGFVVSPISVTLAPSGSVGASTYFTVTFDTAAGQGIGDNQGYVLLDGDSGHNAHLPAWVRVQPEPSDADILLIDTDASWMLGLPDYRSYYITTLESLGLTYEIWNPGYYFNNPATVPDAATLSQYDMLLIYTGDHYQPDGTFTVSTPFTPIDMNRLTEYLNGGGTIFAMGQDLSTVLASDETNNGELFYQFGLGGNFLQDSISDYYLPSAPIVPLADAPPAFNGITLDLSGPEMYTGMSDLLAGNVVIHKIYLPIITRNDSTSTQNTITASIAAIGGGASFVYDHPANRLDYTITIEDIPYPIDMSITINQGAVGENGPAAYTLLSETTVETDTLVLQDAVLLESADGDRLLNGELYIAVKTEESEPFDALRGQITVQGVKDGAANQYFVDELAHRPDLNDANPEALEPGYIPLLRYSDETSLLHDGIVAMSHRDQPTLERPGITYFGRSIYTSFGLEGVNGATDRVDLLQTFTDWAMDAPTVTISNTTVITNASNLTTFQAHVSSNITGTTGYHYRWDFGDGSDYTGFFGNNYAGHVYEICDTYTVRVEVTDSWGNKVIGSKEVEVTECESP
jgi:subtilisin family serine protease